MSKTARTFCRKASPRMKGPVPPVLTVVIQRPVSGSFWLRKIMSLGLIRNAVPPMTTENGGAMASHEVK